MVSIFEYYLLSYNTLFILIFNPTMWCEPHNRAGLQFRCVPEGNPPNLGEVGHTTRVYVPYSFRTVLWVFLLPIRSR